MSFDKAKLPHYTKFEKNLCCEKNGIYLLEFIRKNVKLVNSPDLLNFAILNG